MSDVEHLDVPRQPGVDNPVLSEMVRRLAAVYRPRGIYLFGSTARGDAGPDSDYDLMVIVPDESPDELKKSTPGYAALRGLGVAKDILVSTATNFDRQLHLRASFPSTILREGTLENRPGPRAPPGGGL